jgi:hypothetical protein
MATEKSLFDTEERGLLGILSLKPYQGVALADLSFSHGVVNAIKKFESDGKTVLLVCVPTDGFTPERMEPFWETASHTPPDQRSLTARYAPATNLPLSVIRLETSVGRLLTVLQSTSLFKVIAVEGDVDFDLLGLMLAFDIRFCSRQTAFENRIVDRGAVPGFGVVWYLARHLGQPATVDLILNRRNISAEEAHHLRLITHLSNVGASADDARQYAIEIATRPAIVLKTLAHVTKYLECDFQQYLKQVGGGFTHLPPE